MTSVDGIQARSALAATGPSTGSGSAPEAVTHTGGSSVAGRTEAFMSSQWDRAMGPAATLLSTTTGQLAQQLSGGSTLTQLAAQRGIAHETLTTAIGSGLRSAIPSWKTAGGHVDVEALADVIAGTPSIGSLATSNGASAGVNTFV